MDLPCCSSFTPRFSSGNLHAVDICRFLLIYLKVVSVFYLNNSDVIHDVSYTASTGWTSGRLADRGYTSMPNSSISAMYNQCRLCANTTIIAFQDTNGFFQIGNLTSDGWTLEQLGPDLEPEIGTALALQPFYRSGSEDRINLYYQKSNLNMSLAGWHVVSPGIHGLSS